MNTALSIEVSSSWQTIARASSKPCRPTGSSLGHGIRLETAWRSCVQQLDNHIGLYRSDNLPEWDGSSLHQATGSGRPATTAHPSPRASPPAPATSLSYDLSARGSSAGAGAPRSSPATADEDAGDPDDSRAKAASRSVLTSPAVVAASKLARSPLVAVSQVWTLAFQNTARLLGQGRNLRCLARWLPGSSRILACVLILRCFCAAHLTMISG